MAGCAGEPRVIGSTFIATLVLSCVFGGSVARATPQRSAKSDRPQIPFGFTALSPLEVGVYDSKAQPALEALQAQNFMSQKGWEIIVRQFPELGTPSEKATTSVNPADPEDRRFRATLANEDPGHSPIPLISMICSLDTSEVSGRLKILHDELMDAAKLEDYSAWPAERLEQAIHEMTHVQTSEKGVKYRAPRRTLSFKDSVRLYAITVAFLTKDPKWVQWTESAHKLGYSLPPPPNMADFSNRLRHQLPIVIPPGATRGMLLYRPGWDIAQPLTKDEFEERADVVLIKRTGTTFHLEQFPIYLTVDQKTWNPSWITTDDDSKDSTLTARKFEQLWTRFDGPYLWYKNDQLNGEDTYRATVKLEKEDISIEAERFVLRRGSVVRTARDPLYDPENAQRFVGGIVAPVDPLTADLTDLDLWAPMWRILSKNINETCYRHDDRLLLWYKSGANSWTSSIYPLKDAGTPVLEPVGPVKAPTNGLVARFSGSGAEQPNDVQALTNDQQTSVDIAIGLMNLCLANAGGAEVAALRITMPRDKDNLSPIFFYSVRNGTSVRRSPTSLVVVLSEGYYNGYISAFNRILWVLESAFANDAARNAAINRSISQYLQSALPTDAGIQNDPQLIAWSQILNDGEMDQLFNASILPGAQKPTAPDNTAKAISAAWLKLAPQAEPSSGSSLDSTRWKSAEIAVGLMNLYLSQSSDPTAQAWRSWYPQGTTISFAAAAVNENGKASEVLRESTTAQGEKTSQVNVTVELPGRAYDDYLSSLVWMLGVLEVHARRSDRDGPATSTAGGQGTGMSSVLEYLRQLDSKADNAEVHRLAELGVNWNALPNSVPGIPSMFLNGQNAGVNPSSTSPSGDVSPAPFRPSIVAQFPDDLGMGPLDAPEQEVTRDVVRLMNFYLSKNEDKRDKAAEQFRQTLEPVTNLYLYRNKNEAINLKPGIKADIFVGFPAESATYPGMFVELLRVLEMRDAHLTSSWERRQDIAGSIRRFLDAYGKQNPSDPAVTQLGSLDIKALSEFR